MRQFGIISSSIWRSKRFRLLSSDLARLTYLYLHTTTHGNSAGAFVLPPEMAALELKVPSEDVRAAFVALDEVRLIRYDQDEEMIQILDFFRFNSISSRKHLQGPVRIIKSLPASPVRDFAACDLIMAIFERREEWQQKTARLKQSEHRTDHAEAGKILEAMSGFDTTAAEIIRELKLEAALCSDEMGLDTRTLERLRLALLIPLSHTPIDSRIDITETEKTTEKEKTTDKTTTTNTDKTTERGVQGREVTESQPPAPPAVSGQSVGKILGGDETLRKMRERLANREGVKS
jgi:antitoxin component of RelBE/YafQ-DinJ toxin-antitoxin module